MLSVKETKALTPQQPILYSSLQSQWASVPKLGLAEKGYKKDEVEIKEIDLCEFSGTT